MKVHKVTNKDGVFEVITDSDFVVTGRIHIVKSGSGKRTYAKMNRKYIQRIVMGVTDSMLVVDHINGNKLDNRRDNLRILDKKGNRINTKARGCEFIKGRRKPWRVRIREGSKCIYSKHFLTEHEAVKHYREKHIEMFGELSPYYKRGEE